MLEELVARFRWRLHAYVLMDNHYHLMVETPEANLSGGRHGLQVSCSRMGDDRESRQRHKYRQVAEALIGENEGQSPWDSLEGGIASEIDTEIGDEIWRLCWDEGNVA